MERGIVPARVLGLKIQASEKLFQNWSRRLKRNDQFAVGSRGMQARPRQIRDNAHKAENPF